MDNVRGLGRSLFAAVLLMIGGVLNIIWGIGAIGNSNFFVHDQKYILGDLKTWGWVTLILGILELLAAASLFSRGTFGRVFAIIVAMLVAIDALLDIPAYPFWSLAVFALTLWIIHGLVLFGDDGEDPRVSDIGSPGRPVPPGTVQPPH